MAPCTHLPFMPRIVVLRARWAMLVRGLQLRTIWSDLSRGALYAQAFRRRFVVRRLQTGRARDRETALAEHASMDVALRRMLGRCGTVDSFLMEHCGGCQGFMAHANCSMALKRCLMWQCREFLKSHCGVLQ